MEKNIDLIDLTADHATADQRKDISEAINDMNALFNSVSIFLFPPATGHVITTILDSLRSARFDSEAEFQQELYEQCLSISVNRTLDISIVFAILLTSVGISSRFNLKYLYEKSYAIINYISDRNSWFDKLTERFSKVTLANENQAELDDESFFELLNTDYQIKNLSKKKAKYIIEQLTKDFHEFENILKITGTIVMCYLLWINLTNIGNQRLLYTLTFDIIAALFFIFISLKRLIFSPPQSIHAETIKTLSNINLMAFNGKKISINNPYFNIKSIIFLGNNRHVIYTFENDKKIPFFTLNWADELTRLGIKVISADQEKVIFIQVQKLNINQINKDEIVERLIQKQQQYNCCVSNFNQLKKSLGIHNRNYRNTLNFDMQGIKMNWYYVSGKGPDAFIVIPFVVERSEIPSEKLSELRLKLSDIGHCNWTENNIIIKSIASFKKDAFVKQLTNITETKADSSSVNINNLLTSDKETSSYFTTENIHKRLPIRTYKIKFNKTNVLPIHRWNFTDSQIVSNAQLLNFAEVVYADFELEGYKFHTKAKNLNFLNINGIQTNTLVFFNQLSKEIQAFKVKNNAEYCALKSLTRSGVTTHYGIKKVPTDSNQSMFFRPQDCSKNEVFKVKGHTGIRIFGAKKSAQTGKIDITYSTGEKKSVDAIIDIKHVLYKHQ